MECKLEPFTEEEKEQHRYDSKITLRVAIAIPIASLFLLFIIFPSEEWAALFIIWSILLIAMIITFIFTNNKYYYKGADKMVTTGIITEMISIRHKHGKGNPAYIRDWYRLGNEMILGRDVPVGEARKDDLIPGDKVYFEHFVNKKGKRLWLIGVTKIA